MKYRSRGLKTLRSASITFVSIFAFLIRLVVGAGASDCSADPYIFSSYGFNTLFKRYDKSVILISCGAELPQVKSVGTGFLIDSKEALFLTARHVVIDEEQQIDCTKGRIIGYVLGDMCERVELEYVDSNSSLDVALLRAKQKEPGVTNSFSTRPYLELLTLGMNTMEELDGLGFGQFAAILGLESMANDRPTLPGAAGGHKCEGEPQPYKAQPLQFPNQSVPSHGPAFIRNSNASMGDSGSPIFLADGRVAGIVTAVSVRVGDMNAGTEVVTASDIVGWLVQVLDSRKDLNDTAYSLEKWTLDNGIYDALNPYLCSPSSCIPNVRIAAELQRISDHTISFDKFSKQQINKLRCPIYTAAKTRLIDPQSSFLKGALAKLGVIIEAERGPIWVDRAMATLSNPKYTAYTKMSMLEIAEDSLANDLDAVWREDPNVVAGSMCQSGLSDNETAEIQAALDSYLKSFSGGDTFEEHAKSSSCPSNYHSPRLNEFKSLLAEISDIKIQQDLLVKNNGGTVTSSPISAIALSALANSGSAKGANALIDLGDKLVATNPNHAASAYAKAYVAKPSQRAVAGFDYAMSRSPNLKVMKLETGSAKFDNYVASFAPSIDSNYMTSIVTSHGMMRGVQ